MFVTFEGADGSGKSTQAELLRAALAADGPLWVAVGDSMSQGIGASAPDRGWVGQLAEHLALLRSTVFGNPHSVNPASAATTEHVERTRRSVLRYFNASPDDYIAIFTLNATGALKLVGESYPFAPGGRSLLSFDNHTSVNGIREFARAKGATSDYAPLVPPQLRLDRSKLDSLLDLADPMQDNLFAYPAQSNFSGVKHPLDLVGQAQSKGWDVLLDAAAFVPTSRLDLAAVQPDFVTVSFYKMFGYPTGVGALLVRRARPPPPTPRGRRRPAKPPRPTPR